MIFLKAIPSKRRHKRRQKRENDFGAAAKAIKKKRQLSKPSTLLLPSYLKHRYNKLTGLLPKKMIAHKLAKRRNKLLSKITPNFGLLLTKNRVKLQQALKPQTPTFEVDKRKVCLSRKLRRAHILRVTKGRGLRVRKAVWTDISKLIKCKKKG